MSTSASPYGRNAVRRGLAAFLIGRGVSAILTFGAFSLAAHTLSLGEYGIYAACIALVELLLALSSGGIDWVAARILPESRMHASGRATVRMVLRLFGLQSFIYIAVAAVTLVAAGYVAHVLRLDGATTAFQLAALLYLSEGIGRLSRDQMLGILMEQRSGQLAQISRSGLLLAALAYARWQQLPLDSAGVLQLELLASIIAALLGGILLALALWRLRLLPASRPDWLPPPRKELMRLALHTYSSYLFAIAYGPQVLTMLIARLLGADAVAVFGFARSFADQIRRYLPTDLLQSVIRPSLVAFYSVQGDFDGLMLRLSLWFKSALIVLFPLLLYFAVFGDFGIAAIGGARYTDAWPVVWLLLSGTGMMAWRRVMELAANAVMASDITVRAALILMGIPLIIFISLSLVPWLLPAVLLVAVSEGVFCWRVMLGLRQRGYRAHWDLRGFARLLGGWLACAALLLLSRQLGQWSLPSSVAFTALLALVALLLLRPLCAEEGVLVSGWNKRLASLLSVRSRQ